MGACATKAKELKAERGEAPEAAKEEADGAGLVADSKVEEKEVDVVAVEEAKSGGGDKEIFDDDNVDDQSDRRRSLGHLFKENEESTKNVEQEEKKHESWETVKTIEETEKKLPEAEQQHCTSRNVETAADISISTQPIEVEKAIESVETVEKESAEYSKIANKDEGETKAVE